MFHLPKSVDNALRYTHRPNNGLRAKITRPKYCTSTYILVYWSLPVIRGRFRPSIGFIIRKVLPFRGYGILICLNRYVETEIEFPCISFRDRWGGGVCGIVYRTLRWCWSLCSSIGSFARKRTPFVKVWTSVFVTMLICEQAFLRSVYPPLRKLIHISRITCYDTSLCLKMLFLLLYKSWLIKSRYIFD